MIIDNLFNICVNFLETITFAKGAIQVLRNTMGGVSFSGTKRYEGVRDNAISITRRWAGVKFPGKKHYVTLEFT